MGRRRVLRVPVSPWGLYGGMVCQGDTCLPGRTSLPSGPSRPASLFPRRGGGVYCSSLKNGVFLTVPEGQNSANAAELLAKRRRGLDCLLCVKSHLLVRQAAKGGGVLTFRGSKKYHRFFQWNRKYPTASPKKKARPPARNSRQTMAG